MNTEITTELPEENRGRFSQTSTLVRACLDQPEATSRALRTLLEAEPGNQTALAAVELAGAVSSLYSAQSDTGQDLGSTLAEAAAGLLAGSRSDDAAELLALAVRMGAEGERINELSGEVSAEITGAMREAMSSGDDDAAARCADVLKSLAPNNSEAWLISGRLKLRQGLAEEARIDLDRAVDLSPQSQNTLLNHARAQSASGQNQAAVLTLFKLLRLADGSDGRYRPLATAELETVFNAVAQEAGLAQNKGDLEHLRQCLALMEEIADGVSGSMVEYVAGARNCVRTAVGYARAVLAAGRGRRGLAACDAAMETDPDSAALWSTIARLRLHYHENVPAAQAFRQTLELNGDQASMHDGLAEALFRDNQLDAALSEAESAVAAATGNTAVADRRDRIARVKAALASTPSMPESPRHIAVLGMPNQGNARLGCLIAEATGGAFVGESFWLAGQDGKDESRKFSSCQRCRKPDCSVYDIEFRSGLSPASDGWYREIAERSGRNLLVSTDNSAQIVRRMDPALACDTLIAYRSPASTWALLKEHYASQHRALPELLQFLNTWFRTYSAAMYEFPQLGKRVAVNLDELTGNGRAQLDAMLLGLGLERSPEETSEQHFFGVNASEAVGDFRSSSELVDDLPAAETSVIVSFTDADELYRRLQAL